MEDEKQLMLKDRIESIIKDVVAENELMLTDKDMFRLTELMQGKLEEVVAVLTGVDPDTVTGAFTAYVAPVIPPVMGWSFTSGFQISSAK